MEGYAVLSDKETVERSSSVRKNRAFKPTVAALAVVALSGAVVAGVESFDEQEIAQANVASVPAAELWRTPAVAPQADDPSTWTLPIRAYQVNGNDVNRTLLTAAKAKKAAACLDRFGVAAPFTAPQSWAEAAPTAHAGPKNGMDVRYGDHDLAKVSAYGYGWPDEAQAGAQSARSLVPDAELSPEVELALYGPGGRTGKVAARTAAAPTVNGKAVPAAGCAGETDQALVGRTRTPGVLDTTEDAITKLERRSWDNMLTDPRTLAVFGKWSSCMKAKGFDYKDPWAANDDPRWEASGGKSAEAIATAKADVTCRNSFGVSETMHKVETDWQQRLLKENPKVAAEAKGYTQRVMAQVDATLGR
ncbi:hypothetical protein [Streptomyces sp. SS]|uniref:hypothetical protein n=1 Tax=Streptomyces sp. SS TaxID=260742 RepID=UPI000FFC6A44|nr:hypothetical protein [Streptomyces sp. SS]